MHPMLMTMFAEAQTVALHDAADARRRGRPDRAEPRRRFALRLPRRPARIAHA